MLLFFANLLFSAAPAEPRLAPSVVGAPETRAAAPIATPIVEEPSAPDVPFYSQFRDIQSPEWKKVGCGVTSLAMLIDFYTGEDVSVDALLARGVAAGAYLPSAGWTYQGLIDLGRRYDLGGESYDLAGLGSAAAFAKFESLLADGPIIASVHYKFEPTNPIPHLVVVTSQDGDVLRYNDPAEASGGGEISVADFTAAWKKRFIVIRPAAGALARA